MTDTPDPIDIEVGRRLASRRIALGYNQTDLAQSVGKTFQQIQKYEKGSNRISASVLFKFARFLGVSPEYFFPATDEPAAGQAASPVESMASTRQGHELARLYVGMGDDRRGALLQCARALSEPVAALAAVA